MFYNYRYINKYYTYWKGKGIPYERGVPVLISILVYLIKRYRLHEIDQKRYKKHGKIFGLQEGGRKIIFIGEPDILKDVFVKDFHAVSSRREIITNDPILSNMVSALKGDAKWKRIRTLITPAFTTGKIKKMTEIILGCAKTSLRQFTEAQNKGAIIDAKKIFGCFTMDVIASSAFGTKIESYDDPSNKFVEEAKKLFTPKITPKIMFFALMPKLANLVSSLDFATFFRKIVLQIIDERRRTGQVRNDFLQMMMDAEKYVGTECIDADDKFLKEAIETTARDEDSKSKNGEVTNKLAKSGELKSLSHDELVAQCVLFFLAGYETTASALTFACYFLTINPDYQEKLINEIDDAVRECQGNLTYDCVQGITYLDKVVSETLRMYPPASRIERATNEDYKINALGLTIPKGTIIVVPVYALHHDPEFYPDPEVFDPERFSADAKASRNPYTYLPFGAGPRNCIAMRFALTEIKLCLALILSNFRLKRCAETKIPLEFEADFGLLRPKGANFQVERRTDKVLNVI